jgi:hypothetical protein
MRIIPLGRIIRTAARGEAVDFDKHDKDGRPNPYHGGHRRDATDEGFDRVFKTPHGVWAAHHVPDPTSTDRHPLASVIAEGRSRRDVLDQADLHDSKAFLDARGGHHQVDEASGAETWQVPDRHIGSDYYNVQTPGEGSHSPMWTVTHNSRDRGIVNHISHQNWAGLRDYLTART